MKPEQADKTIQDTKDSMRETERILRDWDRERFEALKTVRTWPEDKPDEPEVVDLWEAIESGNMPALRPDNYRFH